MAQRVDEIYAVLRLEILELELKPRQLISENELSKRFGTSRTTIRSVLQRLQMEQLIDIYPQKGSFVSGLSYERVNNIIYVRFLAERDILLSLCGNLRPETETELTRLLELQRCALAQEGGAELFYELDASFHRTCFQTAGRGEVWTMLVGLDAAYTRLRKLDYQIEGTISQLYREHREIYECLNGQRQDALIAALRQHLEGNVRRVKAELAKPMWAENNATLTGL